MEIQRMITLLFFAAFGSVGRSISISQSELNALDALYMHAVPGLGLEGVAISPANLDILKRESTGPMRGHHARGSLGLARNHVLIHS